MNSAINRRTAPWEPTVGKLLADTQTRAAYEALAERAHLTNNLIRLRLDTGLTQAQVAARMGVTQGRVAQLESLTTPALPSLSSIRRYAEACGSRVLIDFAPPPKRRPARVNGRRQVAERPRTRYTVKRK